MFNVEFKIDLKPVCDELIETRKQTLKGFREAVGDTADDMKRDILRNIPYKTGALKNSIEINYNKQGQEVVIQATAKHAPYVEYGTRAHTIRPRNKKVLAFNGASGMCFAKKVNHPGTKARPFMETAFNKNAPKFIERLEVVLSGSN